MATLVDLRAALDQLFSLQGLPAVLQLNSTTRERAFEAYVLGLLVRAIRQAGGTAVMHGIKSGPNPATIIFRGGPGVLGSAAQDFAFARCQLGDREFELHVDVQYEGSSGALHELDISFYERDAADRVRQTASVFAKTNKLYGAVECKFYDSQLGTSLGRTFVGLVDDCGTLQFKLFCTNGLSEGLTRYFRPKNRPNRFFRLSPLHALNEREFVGWVKHNLREWSGVP